MQKGLNKDLIIKGKKIHVQTEDWGKVAQKIVAKIFKDGRVICSLEEKYLSVGADLSSQIQLLEKKAIEWAKQNL